MIGKDDAKAVIDRVLSRVDAEQAEVLLFSSDTDSTRFSGNAITQNVGMRSQTLMLRVIQGTRQGVAQVNQFDDASLDRCARAAQAVACVAAEDEGLLPVLDRQPEYAGADNFRPNTAETTPAARAEAVGRAVSACETKGLEGAGVFDTVAGSSAYGNSRGVFACDSATKAEFNLSAFSDGGEIEGWAEAFDRDVASLDIASVTETAIRKALEGRSPKDVEPGRWTVILEPAAVAEALLFWGWLAGSGLAFAEGRSFHQGKLGQKILSDKLTIVEDPFHPRLGGQPFDYEGFPRQRVTLVDGGRVAAVVHDRRSARLCGQANTGHANPQPDSHGPYPSHLSIQPGENSLEEMIASTKRGLLVTKLHYTNVVDRMDVSITGMTRAGLFLVEDGAVKHAVKNMRFTQSLLKAFANIETIGREAHPTGGALFGGNFVVPALKINDWNFSSPTGF